MLPAGRSASSTPKVESGLLGRSVSPYPLSHDLTFQAERIIKSHDLISPLVMIHDNPFFSGAGYGIIRYSESISDASTQTELDSNRIRRNRLS